MDGFTHFGTRHIKELREDTVQLLPSGMAYPIFRAESRERFEQLLKNDLRNGSITESLSADPEKADQDLREVLTSGLFTWQDKEYISRWLRDGEGNTKIAKRLSELYSGRVETMDLVTGDIADYRTFTTSIEVEIRKAHENDMESAPDTTPADELIRSRVSILICFPLPILAIIFVVRPAASRKSSFLIPRSFKAFHSG